MSCQSQDHQHSSSSCTRSGHLLRRVTVRRERALHQSDFASFFTLLDQLTNNNINSGGDTSSQQIQTIERHAKWQVAMERFGALLDTENSTSLLYVARDAETDELVGMATLAVLECIISRRGHIEDVVVDERYRGMGIGKQLVEALINEAREQGISDIDLTSSPTRIAANALYLQMGFKLRTTNCYRLTLP
ncbi:GNAT family N-acetyltransferase [Pelomyxa schiedti]|nr:GNAT family N-acetyltransferase [Pelomyxa schiedti]